MTEQSAVGKKRIAPKMKDDVVTDACHKRTGNLQGKVPGKLREETRPREQHIPESLNTIILVREVVNDTIWLLKVDFKNTCGFYMGGKINKVRGGRWGVSLSCPRPLAPSGLALAYVTNVTLCTLLHSSQGATRLRNK